MEMHAIFTIHRNPNGAKEATGEYDDAGNPTVRSVIQIVAPGETFEAGDKEAAELIELGAAIPLADFVEREFAHQKEFAADPKAVQPPPKTESLLIAERPELTRPPTARFEDFGR